MGGERKEKGREKWKKQMDKCKKNKPKKTEREREVVSEKG